MVGPRDNLASSPPEWGRSAREASRVGVATTKFNRTAVKTSGARKLRLASTNVEMRLWQKLRNKQLGADFRRQHPAGNFILDFYSPSLRLAVELDGGQHAQGKHMTADHERDQWLRERGVTVLRFWNSDVSENLAGLLERTAENVTVLKSRKLTPTRRWRADLPLSGGG